MLLLTAKLSKKKLIAAVLIVAVIVSVIIIAAGAQDEEYLGAVSGAVAASNVRTNEDRVAFLARFGWQVEAEPREAVNVTVPEVFDNIFEGYNQLQVSQGLDLSGYRKKTVTRYTYTVTNYPDYDGEVVATLLVYRGRVIGGDICSTDPEGFIHGFVR